MKKIALFAAASALALTVTAGMAIAENEKHPRHVEWPFDGMLGHVDKLSAQRGFQVYKEVCSACHSLNRVAFRSLTGIGFSEAEVKSLAATYQVNDGPNDNGEMFQRPGKPSDHFTPPFPNEKAAAAANGGAAPPDLSLIIKARHDGANYVYSLLTGFTPAPPDVKVGEGLYYNPYFPNSQLRMPPPLSDGAVTYSDGTQASVDQMSRDVVSFLQWAAEPEMETRKQMGLKVMAYLLVFTGFMYVAMKRVWKNIH
jgi:ubiquinol-cytochrome c reductase cytochrome c1 subunit